MSASSNVKTITGAVKLKGLVENLCYENIPQFLQLIADSLLLELPETITNVIVSNIQPSDSQRTSVWIRMSNSGGFLGIYLYTQGSWQQIFPTPQGVFWIGGDSRDLPPGYVLIDATNYPSNFTSAQASQLMAQYIRDNTDTYYVYFATMFEGL